MIILIFVICLILAICFLIHASHDRSGLDKGIGGGVLFSVLAGFAFIVAMALLVELISIKPIPAKIDMYMQENEKIEAQIAECVTNYQKHEEKIFTEVAPEMAITLASLYPELKSDELVKKQINIYIANNEKIKELKNKELNASTYRWWLYFGH